jgi:hypothetical protein
VDRRFSGEWNGWRSWRQPFATNPSFRPPPPLSNDLQNILYAKLSRGIKAGQLAEQHNVSKARIEAVNKLKQVEDAFKRQVSSLAIRLPSYSYDDKKYDITFVLKTPTWLSYISSLSETFSLLLAMI